MRCGAAAVAVLWLCALAAAADDMPGMSGMDMSEHETADMGSMTGLFGGYAMSRDASGTSW